MRAQDLFAPDKNAATNHERRYYPTKGSLAVLYLHADGAESHARPASRTHALVAAVQANRIRSPADSVMR